MEFSINQMTDYLNSNAKDQEKEKIKDLFRKGSSNNRIYSFHSKDKAHGFISTYYTSPLMYANERYFCPIGWRRYGINVGISK